MIKAPLALSLVFALSCGNSKPVIKAPPFKISGTISSLTTHSALACPSVQVKIYGAVPFLLAPSAAKPLATCPVDATTGAFSCSGDDLGGAAQAVVALVDNTDPNATPCVSPTVGLVAACDPTCATSKGGADGELSGDELFPMFAAPAGLLQGLEAAIPSAKLGSLVETGAVLNLVVDDKSHPVAGAKPWLPIPCNTPDPARAGTNLLQCRSVIIGADGHPTAAALTDASGTWLAQVTQHDGTGGLGVFGPERD